MLVEYGTSPAFKALMRSIYSVVFFGPPHRGLEVESLEQLTRGKERHGLITDLEKGSTLLRELNEKFPNVSRNLKIITCFELQATPTAQGRLDDPGSWERKGPSKMMVDRNSACLYTTNETRIAIDKNHSRIAKLSSGDQGYQRLKTILEDDISAAQATVTARLHRFNAMQAIERVRRIVTPLIGLLNYLYLRDNELNTAMLERVSDFLDQLHDSLNADILSVTWIRPEFLSRLIGSIHDTIQTFEEHILSYKDISQNYQQFIADASLNQLSEAWRVKFARQIEKSDRFASQLSTARITKLMKASSSCRERLTRLLWLSLFNLGSIGELEPLEDMQPPDQTGIVHSVRRQIKLAHAAVGQSIGPLAGRLQENILSLSPRVQNFASQGSTNYFPVIVEERQYLIDDQGVESFAAETITELEAREMIKQLTIVLQHLPSDFGNAISPGTPSGPGVGTLQCLGYQETATPGKFFLLFRTPSFVGPFSNKNISTLHARLNSKEFRPTLQQRFQVAKSICCSILHLHCWGWVHKDIRPENIIVISPPVVPGTDLGPAKEGSLFAHIGGFEIARPENVFSRRSKTQELRQNLYRHPQRQQTPSRPFTKTDDLYAVGIILLEIGVQTTVDTIFLGKIIRELEKTGYTPKSETIARRLQELAAAELPQKMGSKYAEAVRKCLTGDFGVAYDDETKSELSIAFQDTVLDAMDHGCQL